MTSVRQITANQGNAQRSTGPKTVAGKDRVARNAVTHGILAQSPVLEGVESREAWEAHLAGIEDSLTPIGTLEVLLVERVALQLWRLGRVARYENQVVTTDDRPEYAKGMDDRPLEAMEDLIWEYEQHVAFAEALPAAQDSEPVGRGDAVHAVDMVADLLGGEYDHEGPPMETAGDVREALETMGLANGRTVEQLGLMLLEHDRDTLAAGREKLAQLRALDFQKYHAGKLVPAPKKLDQVMRYETHLERSLSRSLAELRQLQADRGTVLDGFVSQETN